uniref:Homeobox domain-containing protein n=1 Tax=Timema poppense TaxID=170557 RepID=A0A7R9CRG6_TIMPO|nr:unnamed protein product [Timema poppensis]
MERAQSDLWQGRHVTRRGCDNDDSIICLDDSDSGDGEAEASWFRNINITVEENLEKIKTLYEGCLEPSSPMPQTYTCEQMTVQRTYLGKSQTTCRRQGPNEGIEAEDNTLSNIGTKNVFTDTFTDEQMVILKWEFEENHFPPATRIKKLSERLRLPESKVEGWFIHKRREGSVTSSRGKSKKTDLNKRQLRRLKLNLTVEQINGLEHSFSQDPRPTVHQCGLLAQTLGVSQIDVARWFDNRHKNLKEQIGANVPAEFDETLISKHQLERLNQEFLKSPRLNPDGCGESSAKDPRLSEMSCKDTSNCEDINNRSGLFFYEINSKDSYNDDKINTSDVSKLGEMDDEASQGIYNVSNMCEIICEGFSNHSKINIVSCPNYNNLDNRNNPDICMKPKKKTATPRFFFSEKQVEYLNQEFSTNKTPSRTRIQDLSNRLCVSERRVRRWFKNRRHKDRISKPEKKESISAGQLRCLRVEFVKDCYAFQNRRERIALDLGLTQFKVDNWFKNMRKKMQKTNLNFGDHVARGQFVKQVVRGRKSRESIDHQTEYIDRQLDARGSVPDKEMNRLRDIERTVNSLGSNAGADGRVTPPDISEYLIPSISLCSSPETV